MASGGYTFNDFPQIVPTKEITTKIDKPFFLVGGSGPVSSMGLMLQHQQHPP